MNVIEKFKATGWALVSEVPMEYISLVKSYHPAIYPNLDNTKYKLTSDIKYQVSSDGKKIPPYLFFKDIKAGKGQWNESHIKFFNKLKLKLHQSGKYMIDDDSGKFDFITAAQLLSVSMFIIDKEGEKDAFKLELSWLTKGDKKTLFKTSWFWIPD